MVPIVWIILCLHVPLKVFAMEMVVWVLCFRVSLKVLICDQNGGHFFCRALVVIFNALNQIFLRKQEIQVCQSAGAESVFNMCAS